MNNKMTGLRLISVFIPVIITISLSGCSSTQPTMQQSAPAVQPAPMTESEPVAEPETELTATEMKPDSVASSGIIQPDYPERYVVVKGDTLWGISKRFLKDPWLWPSVWHINPAIRNPHLIYPGDIIVMHVVDGKPYITLDGQAGLQPDKVASGGEMRQPRMPPPVKPGLKVVKLVPTARVSGIHTAINTIPASAIRPFMDRPRVVTEDELDDAPYIVSSYEEHLISGAGNRVYARNLTEPVGSYNIIRPGNEYIDPETDDVLGYEAIYLADARLINAGDDDEDIPATLVVTKSMREVLNNDVLIPYEEHEKIFQFIPRPPEQKVKGQIISVFNGVSQIGQYMVVVLNRGERDGLAPGHVLAIIQKGATVSDEQKLIWSSVDLPDERAGIMMVFKTYKKLSYALVLEVDRALHVLDRFENP